MTYNKISSFISAVNMASKKNMSECSISNSSELVKICELFFSEGLINSYKKNNKKIIISLKYYGNRCLIKDIKPISLRGNKVTWGKMTIRHRRGKYLVRTSKGIMMSTTTHKHLWGGEVLMEILY